MFNVQLVTFKRILVYIMPTYDTIISALYSHIPFHFKINRNGRSTLLTTARSTQLKMTRLPKSSFVHSSAHTCVLSTVPGGHSS